MFKVLLCCLITCLGMAQPIKAHGDRLYPSSIEVWCNDGNNFTFENLNDLTTGPAYGRARIIGNLTAKVGFSLGTIRLHFPNVPFPPHPKEKMNVYLFGVWDVESSMTPGPSTYVEMLSTHSFNGKKWIPDTISHKKFKFSHYTGTKEVNCKAASHMTDSADIFDAKSLLVDIEVFMSGPSKKDTKVNVNLKTIFLSTGFVGPYSQEDGEVFEEVFAARNKVKIGQPFKATSGSTWQLLDKNKEAVSSLKVDDILTNENKASGVVFTLETPMGGEKRTITAPLDGDVVPNRYVHEFATPSQKMFLTFDAEEGVKDSLNCIFNADWE